MLTFGPVPSRRLGRSVGINNIPPKTCSYSCIYCQAGRTNRLTIRRQAFYPPEEIVDSARKRLAAIRAAGGDVDYLTIVPDGEPTLDKNLGALISALQGLGLPVAVISNASLLSEPEVRKALARADWVSLKLDAGTEAAWRRIDRPHGTLRLEAVLDGARLFRETFRGRLVSETMLVAGVNDSEEDIRATAARLAELRPDTAYLSAPIRPPAESWAQAPEEETLLRAFHLLAERVERVELLIGYEGNEFFPAGEAESEFLSVLAVHPMREDAAAAFLQRAGADPAVLDRLKCEGLVREAVHGGRRFYLRRFKRGAAAE